MNNYQYEVVMNYKELNERLTVLEGKISNLKTKNEFMKGLIGKVGMKQTDWDDLAVQLNDSKLGFNMNFSIEGNMVIGRGYIGKKPLQDTYTITIRDTKTANKLIMSISKNGEHLDEVKGLRPKNILSTAEQMIRDFCEDCVPNQ